MEKAENKYGDITVEIRNSKLIFNAKVRGIAQTLTVSDIQLRVCSPSESVGFFGGVAMHT